MQPSDEPIRDVTDYYGKRYNEQARLSKAFGQIEFVRTQRIISRYLKPPPATVLDVGGAAGRYACWLARDRYVVHLIDPVPLHVEQAQTASDAQPEAPIASCRAGDARHLEFEDEVADAVLLMGPLYHLVDAQDRHQALAEAYRVLSAGGRLFAVAISRFASSIDGLASGYVLDPTFRSILLRDLADGQHRNPTQHPAYFTTAYFHHPDELAAEATSVGFRLIALLAIEGMSYVVRDLDQWLAMEDRWGLLLGLIDKLEGEPSLMGASPHIMCVAEKPRPA